MYSYNVQNRIIKLRGLYLKKGKVKNMNKVILMGRLTRDPEVRYTQTNNTLQGEERNADFFNVVAWSKTGEFCSKYFKKGQQVGVIGRLQTRTWDDQNGTKHYITEVVAEEAYFADSKRDGAGAGDSAFDSAFGATAPGAMDGAPEFEVSASDDLPF